MNDVYSFTIYIGKVLKLVYLPIAFAPLYICSLIAKPAIIFPENLSVLKTFAKKLRSFYNSMKVSLNNEIKKKKRNFSLGCTKVTDSVTSVTLNENITNLLLFTLKGLTSPKWGCCVNRLSLLSARKENADTTKTI